MTPGWFVTLDDLRAFRREAIFAKSGTRIDIGSAH